MKTTRYYLGLGAVAGIVAALALANQGTIRDANAEQAVQDSAVESDAAVDTNQSNQVRTSETNQDVRRDTTGRPADQKKMHKAMKASEIIGMSVRGLSGDDNIGSINDLMIHKNGHVNYAAVSFGGFLGIGDKLFAVPFEAVEFVKTDDESYARIDVTEETLQQRQGFNQDNWPEKADKSFSGGNVRQAGRPVTDTSRDSELER